MRRKNQRELVALLGGGGGPLALKIFDDIAHEGHRPARPVAIERSGDIFVAAVSRLTDAGHVVGDLDIRFALFDVDGEADEPAIMSAQVVLGALDKRRERGAK